MSSGDGFTSWADHQLAHAREFEAAMENIRAKLSLTREDADSLAARAIELSRSHPTCTPADAHDAIADGMASGLSQDEAVEKINDATRAGLGIRAWHLVARLREARC